MRTRMIRLGAALAVCALIAAGCSDNKSSNSSSSSNSNKNSTQTTINNDPAINQYAQQYTGAKALQKATGAPLTIGYVNNDSLFPEATIGVDAAVAYANAELNGADGREIVLKKCEAATAADGARCGAEMANDTSINLVLTGTLLEGNSDLYKALNGKKAVIIGNGVVPDDFLTSAGEAFVAGAPGVLTGMAKFAVSQFHPHNVSILANDNAAGHAGVDAIMKPILTQAGANVKSVYVPNEANGTQVQSAMQAVGAGQSDVFLSILTLQSCIGMYDAIKALNVHPNVVTTGLCFGTKMAEHLQAANDKGDYPDGWYFGGYGYSYYLPSTAPHMQDSGMNTYLAKVHQYGKPAANSTKLEYSGFAGPMFGNVLTAIKFINEIGVANATVTALDQKIRSFTGPMMLQVGPLKCNQPPYVAVCGQEMGIQQYKQGTWISIADGHNGQPIKTTG